MKNNYDTYHPKGFSTLNPYLFAENAPALIAFLKNAFDAEEINRSVNPENGDIANCILKIGDSCFMVSQARGDFLGMRTSFYLFVSDVDAAHQKAVEKGAEEVLAPADMSYGDRQSGVKDPAGNYWWISKRLEEKGYNALHPIPNT